MKQPPVSAEARRAAARTMDATAYWRWARPADVAQDFWFPLLNDPGALNAAVVYEASGGFMTLALASRFEHVYALHRSADAHARTRQVIEASSAGNVLLYLLDPQWPWRPPVPVDAIIQYCLDGDPCGQWRGVVQRVFEDALEMASDCLSPAGSLVLGANNRWGHIRAARGELSLRSGYRKTRERFHDARVYTGSSPLQADQDPPPDLHALGTHESILRVPGVRGRIKRALIDSNAGRQFWPSFLVVGGRRRAPLAIESAMRANGALQQGDSLEVWRLVAGNHGISVLLASRGSRAASDVVIRVAHKQTALCHCRRNEQALGQLAGTVWRDLVPVLLASTSAGAQYMTAETACQGYERFSDEPGFIDRLPEATRQTVSCHVQSGSSMPLGAADFDRLVQAPLQDVAHYCDASCVRRLNAIARELRNRLLGRHCHLGVTHGDFKLGNLLFDRHARLRSVIDWDGFEARGVQIFDYLTLILFMLSHDFRQKHDAVFRMQVLPWTIPQAYDRCVAHAVQTLCPDRDTFALLRMAFWFYSLSARHASTYKEHPAWALRYVVPMLPAMESELRLAG
jgi:hypothetical protein